MNQLKVGLVISNAGLLREVQTSLSNLPVRVLLQQTTLGDVSTLVGEMEQFRLDVLLIDLSRLPEPYESVIRKVRSCSASPLVIALSDSADPETILGAIRAGASEYLYPPVDGGLRKAIERMANERAKSQSPDSMHRARTIGFLSAKGGCGATTIACHVAVEMQKATGRDVLLADLDLDSGLVGFLMKSKSTYTIMDALKNVHRMDVSYWKALVSNGHAGLEIIAGPPAATVRELVDGESLRHVVQFARCAYDWIVADLGRSLGLVTAAMLDEIDETYVVATLDLPALQQTKQVVQAALDLGYSRERLRLVLNRSPKRTDFDLGQVQKILGLPIFDMLPNAYPELFEATSEGNLLPTGSELGKAFTGLAGKIAGVQPSSGKDRGKGKLNLSFF